jgi:hypothetical protein
MGCVGYNLRARMALAVLVGHAIVKHLSGAIMGQDSFIPVATNAKSRSDLVERGFSRQPLRVDVDIARSLEALSHAAWSVPKDKYQILRWGRQVSFLKSYQGRDCCGTTRNWSAQLHNIATYTGLLGLPVAGT